MAMISCVECGGGISDEAYSCPHCGYPLKPMPAGRPRWGFEWRTEAEILGWPLIHVAIGRDKKTGRLLAARGVIAVGQFAIGLITFAQFGIGVLFAFGQFTAGLLAIGQIGLGVYFGLGQVATGSIAIGQFAVGEYVFAQIGYGAHVWSTKIKDPEAIEYFTHAWDGIRHFFIL